MSTPRAGRQTYFTCLLPPENLRKAFNEVAKLAPADADVKAAADLHITLNYLQIPRKRHITDLMRRLGRLEYPSFNIQMTDVDMFYRIPNRVHDSHVVWLRPAGLDSYIIRDLHARIFLTLRPLGYTVGANHMTPHMTALKYPFQSEPAPLAKFIEEASKVELPAWKCDRFYLARSRRMSDTTPAKQMAALDSKYEILEEYKLG